MEIYNEKSHTFVVCAYQESPFLDSCIRSLLRQTIKTSVCIATSTPNEHIRRIAEKYRLPVFINEGEKGIAGDWNFACVCAQTPLVTLAHQDDVYDKNYTKDILEALSLCCHPLIAFTDYYELRGNMTVKRNRLLRVKHLMLSPLKVRSFWKSRFVRRRILSMGSAICCPSVTLVKKNLQLPVFQNNMKSNIDWQAWESISKQKGEFVYVAKPSIKHRIHQESTTSELLKMNGRREEDLYMYRKFWPEWMARLIEKFYQNSEKSNTI